MHTNNKPKVLAIIPARGGSKGVPGKNIRLLDGKPLIAYAIECAAQSESITNCLVNTDDEEIAAIARSFEGEVIMRQPGQGADDSPILPVILSTLDYAEKHYAVHYDLVILLQVTAPLRRAEDVDAVVQLFENANGPDGVISVVPMSDTHPARMYQLDENQRLQPIWDNGETAHRQELKPVYLRNGCIYAVKTEALRREHTLMVKNKQAYIMPEEWLANIDTERDFAIAEVLVKQWNR